MIENALNRLKYILDTVPKILTEIGERKMSIKPLPNKWSKKEIIGHLIDSATNNHQRFVRGQCLKYISACLKRFQSFSLSVIVLDLFLK